MLTNHWQILVTVLLAAGVVLSTLRYFRGRLSTPKKILLTALRAGWIVGLALSFYEPVIRFERFESGRMRIPVLIDVSLSMQNFSPEAGVIPFLDTLSSLQSRTGGRVGFEFFLFGDSTRVRQPSSAPLLFDDTKSYFPPALDDADGKFSSDMIIISDGHWTRPRRSSEVFPRNTIHYLVLPDADPNPFVTVSYNAPESTPSDSAFTVTATAAGYVREGGTLIVSLKEKGRVVRTESVQIEEGYFTQTVRFRTSNSRPGRRLYTVEAVVDTAVPPSVSSFVHQTTPHFLTYSMYSATPTLDRRYMSQALTSNRFFRERVSSPDLLFLFDWDTTAARLTRALPRHAVTVFLGALPCSSSSIAAPSISIRPVDDNNTLINPNLDLRSMPPPQEIITCRQLPTRGTRRILQATVNQPGGRSEAAVGTGGNRTDNLPILFSGRFRERQSLFCPVRGIWRWDFWPMSSDRAESELFSFSNTIISAARELLLDNISDQLILYPANTLTETDSARFMMSLPAAVPVFEPLKLSVQIQNENVTIDTAISYTPTGLNRQPLSFRALPPGRYAISSSLDGGGVNAVFADSFTVNKDMSELSVLAQNTQYLQEFAQPLDPRDADALNAIFAAWDQRGAERSTVTETMRINRSWLLLGLMLALLAIELILRRRWGVD
jgi:hypothetical protein